MTPVNSERAGSDVSELVARLRERGRGGTLLQEDALLHREAASALEQQARRIAVLEAAVRQWASECAECGGTGLEPVRGGPAQPCVQCADIRAALEETP